MGSLVTKACFPASLAVGLVCLCVAGLAGVAIAGVAEGSGAGAAGVLCLARDVRVEVTLGDGVRLRGFVC